MNYSKDGVTIRESRQEDIAMLKDHLRKQDEEEILATGYANPEAALAYSFSVSVIRFTVEFKGVCVAMGGLIAPGNDGEAANIWLLGAEQLKEFKKAFVRLSRQMIAEFLLQYSILWNLVDGRYIKAIRWLSSCGAVFNTEPTMINGHEFYEFTIRR